MMINNNNNKNNGGGNGGSGSSDEEMQPPCQIIRERTTPKQQQKVVLAMKKNINNMSMNNNNDNKKKKNNKKEEEVNKKKIKFFVVLMMTSFLFIALFPLLKNGNTKTSLLKQNQNYLKGAQKVSKEQLLSLPHMADDLHEMKMKKKNDDVAVPTTTTTTATKAVLQQQEQPSTTQTKQQQQQQQKQKEEEEMPPPSTIEATASTTTKEKEKEKEKKKKEVHWLYSKGFGVDISNAAREYYQNIYVKNNGNNKYGIDFEIKQGPIGWHYARGVCPNQDLSCYFEFPPKPIETKYLNISNPIGQIGGIRALTVPIPEVQKDINMAINNKNKPPKSKTNNDNNDRNCGVIHVRHSDTILNFGWKNMSDTPTMKYLSLEDHVNEFEKAISSIPLLKSKNIKDIVLLTDDQYVIDDMNNNYQDKDKENGYHWYYLEKKRWKGAEGGWENHFPSGSRRQEMIDILTEREMVSNCIVWVGTRSSFGHALRATMDDLDPKHVVLLTNDNGK